MKRNMNREKQKNESSQMILQAFIKLVKEGNFKEITLTEIADHAGLTRMTLHRHFKSKEEILLYIAQKYHEEAWDNWKGDRESFGEILLFSLERVKNMPNRSLLLASREIWETLQSFRKKTFIVLLEKSTGQSFENDPHLFHFLLGGINNMLYEWIGDECREFPSEIKDRIMCYLGKLSQ